MKSVHHCFLLLFNSVVGPIGENILEQVFFIIQQYHVSQMIRFFHRTTADALKHPWSFVFLPIRFRSGDVYANHPPRLIPYLAPVTRIYSQSMHDSPLHFSILNSSPLPSLLSIAVAYIRTSRCHSQLIKPSERRKREREREVKLTGLVQEKRINYI